MPNADTTKQTNSDRVHSLRLLLLTLTVLAIAWHTREAPEPGGEKQNPLQRFGVWMEEGPIEPTPWFEVERKSSPDGLIDAVVITGYWDIKSVDPNALAAAKSEGIHFNPGGTSVRLVAPGRQVQNEPPFYSFPAQYSKRVSAKAAFNAKDVENIAIDWLDNRTLQIRASCSSSSQADHYDAVIGKATFRVALTYDVQYQN